MKLRTDAALFALLACFAACVAAAAPSVTSTDSVDIPVGDLERSVDFYTQVLDFKKIEQTEISGADYERLFGVFGVRVRIARLQLGDEFIELMNFVVPDGRPIPVDSHSNDLWFQHVAIIVRDMDTAYRRLRDNKVRYASTEPQTLPDWNPNAGGIKAFYFRDPDGNHLEILQFPTGKGAEKWHRAGNDLFMGIDHTAIAVADTDASIRFYRNALGMKVVGASDNYGTEQEHLNNVFGAHLRITALRSSGGPGVELLEYLTPRTGRSIPVDSTAVDRWYWQINMTSPSVAALGKAVVDDGYRSVSTGVTALDPALFGTTDGFIVRDPDGHAVQLIGHTPLPPGRQP
ncbi:MAG TPA: VOC family protein [Pseudomonadales bacterium]|nr:VOC family protein [Pseudomonadales bacterium]